MPYTSASATRQTLSVLVDNYAGVLSQVSRLFSRKGFNIESLAVGTTDNPEISRITIEVIADEQQTKQVMSQLSKLFPVRSVKRLEPAHSIRRELLLIKVKAETREIRNEVIQIANIFRASIIDVSLGSITLAIIGTESKDDAIEGLLKEFGILELARTGMVALERGQYTLNDESKVKGEYDYGKLML
ncbi:MAG: acetolactate synthase small subunit [Oscillospiraceae bacterium]|nr:acetolactate synthase small subunit [Oscillospiraceae bacterium]